MPENFLFLIFAAAVTAAAFFFQRITGFGSAILATPVLSLFWDPHNAINLQLIFQALFAVILIGRTWRSLLDKKLHLFLALFIPTTILGAYFLPGLSEEVIRWAIAGVTLSVLLQWLFFPNLKLSGKWQKPSAVVLGAMSGIVQGMFGTGGPFFLLYYGSVEKESANLRDASIAVFFIANVLRVPVSLGTAQMNSEILWAAVFTLPFFALALHFGGRLTKTMDEKMFRWAIIGILAVASLNLFFK